MYKFIINIVSIRRRIVWTYIDNIGTKPRGYNLIIILLLLLWKYSSYCTLQNVHADA